ncbi:MAG: lipocalin-like domain-containing protein [Wenzhouxiangellaceae bacterium]|nr:lipocalin-like domain-containing protein [Wenzhouxiangellaceae bacterium]
MKRDLLIVLVLCALAAAWLGQRAARTSGSAAGRLNTTALLGAAPEEFRRVTGPRLLTFPDDHAMHPGFRNEWWYFTGNLADGAGRRFGFQFTLFRFALGAGMQADSDFAADAIWMAHLAVSDIANERFHARERFARGALGLAGATADEWWLRDWRVRLTDRGWRLRADAGEFALELDLAPVKPIVLHGQAGYSRKGPEPGNASRYYSITRLAADGRVGLGGLEHEVSGTAWLDREWGSSQLGEGLSGWDWFALQLDDGRDLMLYRLRTEAGTESPFSAGMLVTADGEATVLAAGDFELEPRMRWRDPQGIDWPVGWRLAVPAAGLELDVEAAFEAQRWNTSVEYWEGAVDVFAAAGGEPAGRGYMELSGYAESAGGRGADVTAD